MSLALLASCHGRTVSLRHGDRVAAEAAPPARPTDGVEVEARVTRVSHPVVDSPSLVGDRSTATLEVLSGALPGAAGASRVLLSFDRHGPAGRVLEPRRRVVLRFTREGRLFDVR